MLPIYFFSYFHRASVPGTIFNEIQVDMGLSASAVAGLGALFLGIYAGTQLFIGMAVDRFGGRRMLLGGALLMAAGGLWFPAAGSLTELYAARALTGFGASFMFLSIVHEVESLFGPRRFPAIMGMVLFVGYAGGMSATLPFAALTAWVGWRPALMGIGCVMALFGFAAWFILRRLAPAPHSPVHLSFRPLLGMLASTTTRPLILGALTNYSVFFVIQNVVGKKFLQDVVGLSSNRAAFFVLIKAGVGAGVSFLSGFWLKLSGQRRKPVLLAFGGILVLGTLLLAGAVAFRAPAGVFLVAYIVLAASVGSGPTGSTVVKELNRADCVAQSVALLNGVTYLGVSMLAAVAGWILDWFAGGSVLTATGRLYPMTAYLTLFLVMLGIALFSVLCFSRVPETWNPHRKQPSPVQVAEAQGVV